MSPFGTSLSLPHQRPTPTPGRWRIGLFDSGVGGLSILRELRLALPHSQLLYVADSAHAPYGERDIAHILRRSKSIAAFLHAQGAQLLLVACNSATAAAVHELRALYPEWPIIGVEPGLKPAALSTRNGRISVMATTATLSSEKFQHLLRSICADSTRPPLQVHPQACPGLAHAIEQGDVDAPAVIELVQRYGENIRAHGSDTVVLGCTHYPLVRHHIDSVLGPEVLVIDTALAIARRALQLCAELPQLHDVVLEEQACHDAGHLLWSSGDAAHTQHIATQWLNTPTPTLPLPAPYA